MMKLSKLDTHLLPRLTHQLTPEAALLSPHPSPRTAEIITPSTTATKLPAQFGPLSPKTILTPATAKASSPLRQAPTEPTATLTETSGNMPSTTPATVSAPSCFKTWLRAPPMRISRLPCGAACCWTYFCGVNSGLRRFRS